MIRLEPPGAEELAARGVKPERARDPVGTFKADDPATPENEAWVAPAPAPKRSRKKGTD